MAKDLTISKACAALSIPVPARTAAALEALPQPSGCELILTQDRSRLVAIIIPRKITIAQIELLYAIGERGWKDCCRLLRPWNCWAVLADEDWALDQVRAKAPRPSGFKVFFAS